MKTMSFTGETSSAQYNEKGYNHHRMPTSVRTYLPTVGEAGRER